MKKPTYADLEKRVAELEAKVKELGAQHIHYHYTTPAYQPAYTPSEPVPIWLTGPYC